MGAQGILSTKYCEILHVVAVHRPSVTVVEPAQWTAFRKKSVAELDELYMLNCLHGEAIVNRGVVGWKFHTIL